jgi:hypothetical protein
VSFTLAPACEPADPAAEREPGHPDRPGEARGNRELVRRGGLDHVRRASAGFEGRQPVDGIDLDAPQRAGAEQQRAVEWRERRRAVTRGLDGDAQATLGGTAHRRGAAYRSPTAPAEIA